jgi:hypothetical protein
MVVLTYLYIGKYPPPPPLMAEFNASNPLKKLQQVNPKRL